MQDLGMKVAIIKMKKNGKCFQILTLVIQEIGHHREVSLDKTHWASVSSIARPHNLWFFSTSKPQNLHTSWNVIV